MVEILRNRSFLMLVFMSLFFMVVILFLFFNERSLQEDDSSPLDNAQSIRDRIAEENANTFISSIQTNDIGDQFVTIQGKLVGIIDNGDENILQIEISSLEGQPSMRVDIGPDNLRTPYTISEFINIESEEVELVERSNLLSNRNIMSSLSSKIGKDIKLQILTNTNLSSSSNSCLQDCQLFLTEFEKYKDLNQILITDEEFYDNRQVGAVFLIWEPYE